MRTRALALRYVSAPETGGQDPEGRKARIRTRGHPRAENVPRPHDVRDELPRRRLVETVHRLHVRTETSLGRRKSTSRPTELVVWKPGMVGEPPEKQRHRFGRAISRQQGRPEMWTSETDRDWGAGKRWRGGEGQDNRQGVTLKRCRGVKGKTTGKVSP